MQQLDRRSSTGIGIGRKKEEGKILENINTKFYVATEVLSYPFTHMNNFNHGQ